MSDEQLRYEEEKHHYEMDLIDSYIQKGLIPERYRVDEFDQWWESIGSGITPEDGDDCEEHAKCIAEIAWKAATEAANER
jgi:hypothetical protein